MAEKPEATDAKTATPAKKGSNLKIIIALVVVLVMAAGGGFYYFKVFNRTVKANVAKHDRDEEEATKESDEGDEEQVSEEQKKKRSAEKAQAKALKKSLPNDKEVKRVIELPPFILNLADKDESRYLRISINVGVGGEEKSESKPDALFNARVRNALLAVLVTKSSNDLLSEEGKTALRKELLKAVQTAITEPQLEAIYITEFIVQK